MEAAVGKGAYRLKLTGLYRRLHPVFPVVKLLPAPEDPFPGRISLTSSDDAQTSLVMNSTLTMSELPGCQFLKGG